MTTVFFSYFLRDGVDRSELERQLLEQVAPAALAQETVEHWILHRTRSWPGASYDSADYVCVVRVSDLTLWSAQASGSIAVTHGALGSLVSRVEMAVTDDVVGESTPAGD